jgi:hypothetical protein
MTRSHKKARPKETFAPVLNPHKGCATFQRFNGDPLYPTLVWSESGPTEFPPRAFEGVAPGYLPTTVSYCRWFWDLFEPEDGRIDFRVIEQALATAAERGQTLQVRLMPHGSSKQPKVPAWYREKFKTVERITHAEAPPSNAPIYDSPEFIDRWGRVVTEFGRCFEGDPRLESVDMSFIGPWGEGAGECSEAGIDRMIAIYKAAHPKTPLMAMIDGYKMAAGVRAGMGWRLDCFGDLGIFPHPGEPKDQWWMHHFDCYPQEVVRCGAQDAWTHAPVTFESCGVPQRWFNLNFDLEFLIQQGLKFHGTVFMPKSTAMPPEWTGRLEAFCNDLGYRFVFRQLLIEARAKRGTPFEWRAWIENVGVAPIYRRYTFAIRATQGNRVYYHHSPGDILTWLPGDGVLDEKLALPKEFQPGSVMLHAALVNPETNQPKVRFAVEGTEPDGWLPLTTVEVE